ncbi:DNA methyltransferase [Chitinophaga sancti]|uniref:DNA methylase n=1 Tax=Chitinophaga sancti TaxID=1004 RepID=A0A1K1M3A9_9BACT|nr:DNA methyltransferase [Chitinophaga sancti]WQD64729.1 DNA methyltransferase [Chitinophaga sancti]WQG89649.1 DNA methyltransferase [Chitinophaga sancti]SFW16430.1 DNA methylase [Chitinophaga sancti]
MIEYNEFLKRKVRLAGSNGFEVSIDEINPALKPHNRLMVKWNVEGGRRANFASFGLHKTVTQLETIRIILTRTGGRGLIIAPLGVRQEFINDARNILGWQVLPKFIRSINECEETGIYITNYETVRDGKIDPRLFQVASLDEASILRGFGGSKTFREFMRLFTGDGGPLGNRRGSECVPYRFVATATPSPNDYIELLAYADFLGIMDISQAKTRFFKRDSTKADKLTLHAHKEKEFWLWVASWGLFVQKPSDITGDPADDQGYILPELDLRWHELPTDHTSAGSEKSGQGRLFKDVALGLTGAAKEKRDSLSDRISKLLELRAEDPAAHRIIWHDLESERQAIEKAIPSCQAVYGSQKLEVREDTVSAFAYGQIQELAAKPCMLGSGTNLQRHCHWAIYLGIGFKFNDFIQSIHRLLRFLQQHRVRIDLIYTEAEREVRKVLETKWQNHNKQVRVMTDIIKEFGLSQSAMANLLTRKIGVERIEVKGSRYRIVNNDCVLEARRLESNSIGLVLTSIPFATQYEYSPNYSDFGHSENNEEFFEQMDYLTPELYRALIPGRIAAIHVKDRIVPIGMTGLGTQTSYPFHCHTIMHFQKHGFAYMGMKTIVTDVVRENNQTYRLGWSEQCKDGSKMGVGMPEYLLLFRKPPTDTSNSYADIPVVKQKKEYSLSKWQVDAHGYARSSGDRLLTPNEIAGLEHDKIFKVFKDYSLNHVYDFDYHVSIGDSLEATGKLPTTFMLLQPQSWSDDVWTDITRMRTLNSSQYSKGKEMHLCPLQIDLGKRVINQLSNKGDMVLDPFGGIMTVPSLAVELERFGVAFELNHNYFIDGAAYCKAAEESVKMPTLFDL